jgi:hypothetical protein
MPSSLAIHLAGEGLKFTPGRAAIALLFVPAIAKLLQDRRRFLLPDLFVFLTSAWMIGSRFQDDGLNASAVAEVIELLGGYVVARAYFFERQALEQFMRVFKVLVVIVILLASLEPLAGTNVVTKILQTPVFETQFRYGVARAQSTIEDAELFGTLCCVAGCLTLYTTPLGGRRFGWLGFCFFGCILAISSGPLLAFALMIAAYAYDRVFKQFAWRWKAFCITIACLIASVFLISKNPTDWLVSHLTLDPATGYFRLYAFDWAEDQIAIHPYKGWGFEQIEDYDPSVDCVWLVCALRFGLPMMYLLLLTNFATFYPKGAKGDPYINNAGKSFTFAIVCLMVIGLTVHYWNAIWMLWAVCLGIRTSIKESQVGSPSYDIRKKHINARAHRRVIGGH